MVTEGSDGQPDAATVDTSQKQNASRREVPLAHSDSATVIKSSVEQQDLASPKADSKRVRFADHTPRWQLHARSKSAVAKENKRKAAPLKSAMKKRLTAKPRPSGTSWDNQDRMLLPAEFSKIQKMIGLKFTMDACCNPDGSNALVPELYKSAQDSFLEYNCAGQNVWLNPPYADMTPFIKHYVECKTKSPHNTSAVLILPKWRGSHTHYLKGMHVIKEFPKGSRIFSAPGATNSSERIPLGPTPWPVQVLYDPPVAVPLACIADLPVLDGQQESDTNYAQSELSCVHFQATIAGANARGLADSGASHSLLSAPFCKANGIVISPAPQTVEVADGRQMQVLGVCNARIQIGQYKAVHKCWVTTLHPAYDLILGRTWLKLSKAIINGADNTLSVVTAKGRIVITSQKPDPAAAAVPSDKLHLLTVKQANRAVRKQQTMLVFCSEVKEQGSASVATTTHGLIAKPQLEELLHENADIFSESLKGMPPDRGDTENIINLLPGAVPKSIPQFRLTQDEREAITEYVKELLDKKLIEPSSSPWGAPVLFVPKKRGEGWKGLRLCIDYRLLNKQTVRNSFPIPRIDDLVDQLGQAKVFSSLDLTSGYWQCRLSPSDCPKTAFRTPFGLFQWKVAPMGLSNSPARFQSVMNRIFQPLLNKCVTVYLDDILIFSKTPKEHIQHLKQVFDILRTNQFVVSMEKSQFNLPEVQYLGHIVGRDGLKVDPKKVEAVQNWSRPETVTQVRSFVGFVNYFRRFIDHFADKARPLNELLKGARKKHAKVTWTSDCQQSFDELKRCLTTAPVLVVPDFSKPFVVEADASDFCLGAVLLQEGHPVAYESRTFLPAERNYHTTERELAAVVHALKIWRCYLWGSRFTINSDHEPLKYLQSKGALSARQARWSEFLSAFNYVWVYKKGSTMMADALSRLPQPTCAAAQVSDASPTLKQSIAEASKLDDWFTKPRNVRTLVKRGDCWYKGNRIVVPASVRLQVLEELHDAPYSGHRGVTKTVALVSANFWWPKMRDEIQHHVRTCAICQVAKAKSVKPGGQLQPLPIPTDRWESIAMDFITDLPCTPSGKDAILVFVDRLTRMVLFAPCTKDIDTLGTAKLLRDYVFCHHGLPVSIVSDRDPRFTSKVWTELMKLLGTRLNMSSAFHPQTDGLTERYNRVLEEYLRSYVSATYDDWDQWLPLAQFAVNNSKQESLQATPFYLNFGRHPRTPATVTNNSDLPGAEEFASTLHKAITEAKSALQAAQQRQKAFADNKTRRIEFAVGQKVLLDTRNLTLRTTGPNKLLQKYVGPFKVQARVGAVAYRLELPATMKCHPVFHVSLLHKWNPDGRHQPLPPPIAVDEEGTWHDIDSILDHKQVKRGRKLVDRYLVKWAGFGPEHNEWRDAVDVTDVAIQAYRNRQAQVVPRRRGRRQQ